MTRKLTKQGNSLVFVVGRELRELTGIDEDTVLNVSVEGRKLIIEPMSETQRANKFKKALATTNRRYAKDLKKLAE